jgi:hypothetical protein
VNGLASLTSARSEPVKSPVMASKTIAQNEDRFILFETLYIYDWFPKKPLVTGTATTALGMVSMQSVWARFMGKASASIGDGLMRRPNPIVSRLVPAGFSVNFCDSL